MRYECFEVMFRVTETCQNGKERTVKKSVYSKPYRMDGDRHIFVSLDKRIEKCVAVLEQEHYYGIEYLGIKRKTLLMAEWE